MVREHVFIRLSAEKHTVTSDASYYLKYRRENEKSFFISEIQPHSVVFLNDGSAALLFFDCCVFFLVYFRVTNVTCEVHTAIY